jgi:hypothetical protein
VNSNELLVDDERLTTERLWRFKQMTTLLLICIAAAAPVVGIGLMNMQDRLERWDYERHAED